MGSKDWKSNMIGNALRRSRLVDKAAENLGKPPLVSDDVVQTADFTFSPFCPGNRVGDSGALLLAKAKEDRSRRYLVKHAYTDCACNEFVYTKLAQAMGVKMPDAVLFQLSPDEKRPYFKTEYIIGLKYLNLLIEDPTYRQIREQACNWQDYFRFKAMYEMFVEVDSFETPLAADGFIYRVDTTASFLLSNMMLSYAGVNVSMNMDITAKESIR